MITAHVTNGMLRAYADGRLSDGMSLLTACHLTYCPECRSKVARLEALCGAMLAEARPVSSACLSGMLARLDGETDAATDGPANEPPSPLPRPVRMRLGHDLDAIDWQSRLPGLHECPIAGLADEQVSLLRASPNADLPRHSHTGREATLVLLGQLRDGAVVYRRGDVALADATVVHQPEVAGEEECLCLQVLSGEIVLPE